MHGQARGLAALVGYPNVPTNDSVIHCQINAGAHVALHGDSKRAPQEEISTLTLTLTLP